MCRTSFDKEMDGKIIDAPHLFKGVYMHLHGGLYMYCSRNKKQENTSCVFLDLSVSYLVLLFWMHSLAVTLQIGTTR